MEKSYIREAREEDYPEIIRLNDNAVEHTSPMDSDRLSLLASLAVYFRVAVSDDQVVAFILAMKDGVPYYNDNYVWFSSNYDSFLYVDRIVVAGKYRGCGIGTALYRDIFSYAQQEGIPIITCEINSVPPNKTSAAFHARLGFHEVGSQWICEGRKKVSMQAAPTNTFKLQ